MWKQRNNSICNIEDYFKLNMGVQSLQDVNEWFTRSYNDQYTIKGLDEAVSLITGFRDKPITIVGDYDVDGITSTSILLIALRVFGCKDISFRIPRRFTEGYGINDTIVDEIKSGLFITTDNGISQISQIEKAKINGLSVIVVDHHLPYMENGITTLPPADVIINPNAIAGSADFTGYCAAGLCYKLGKRLLDDKKYATVWSKLQSLATIGTIADVMELKQENYVLVRNGIKKLLTRNTTTCGMYALMDACGALDNPTATDLAFKVAPVINAVSRMNDEGARDAVWLIANDVDSFDLIKKAKEFTINNDNRKNIQKDAIEKAEEIIKNNHLFFDIPLVINLEDVPEGVIGIVAGNLCEKYKRPVICFTETEGGLLKGSGRSCGNFHIKNALDTLCGMLVTYGGHEGAAGLSIQKDDFGKFAVQLKALASDFQFDEFDDIYYDLEISKKDIAKCIDEMARFEPFGEGNPRPVFRIRDFTPVNKYGVYKSLIGKDKKTVKLTGKYANCIGFGMADKMEKISCESPIEVIGDLSNNYFNGSVSRRVMFKDFQET